MPRLLARALRMIGRAIADYSASVSVRSADAARKSEALAADRARVVELEVAVSRARASEAAERARLTDAKASHITHKNAAASAKATEKSLAKNATDAATAERAGNAERDRAEHGLKTFGTLESSGPDGLQTSVGRAIALKQALKEVETNLEDAEARDALMPTALKRVLPALKIDPASRERFDEAALAAAEGCLNAHLQQKMEAAAALGRSAAAGRSRANQAAKESARARQDVADASERIQSLIDRRHGYKSAVRSALAATRRHAASVKTLADAACDCNEALAEAEAACRAVASLEAAAVGGVRAGESQSG